MSNEFYINEGMNEVAELAAELAQRDAAYAAEQYEYNMNAASARLRFEIESENRAHDARARLARLYGPL